MAFIAAKRGVVAACLLAFALAAPIAAAVPDALSTPDEAALREANRREATRREGANLPLDESPAAAGPSAEALLEKKYAEELHRRVAFEAKRADESLESLWHGVTFVFGAVLLLGLFAMWMALRHQKQLDRMKADAAAE